MIRVKPGVRFHPDTWVCGMTRILRAVEDLAPARYTITITSGCDGKHREGSKHYKGRALDFRTRDFPYSPGTWARRIQNRLGDEYFVLVEPTHMHIQWNG